MLFWTKDYQDTINEIQKKNEEKRQSGMFRSRDLEETFNLSRGFFTNFLYNIYWLFSEYNVWALPNDIYIIGIKPNI